MVAGSMGGGGGMSGSMSGGGGGSMSGGGGGGMSGSMSGGGGGSMSGGGGGGIMGSGKWKHGHNYGRATATHEMDELSSGMSMLHTGRVETSAKKSPGDQAHHSVEWVQPREVEWAE